MNVRKIDLAGDSIGRVFIHYAVPSVLGMLAMSTAQVVDGVFIGRFVGPEGLAAINLAWPLVMGFTGLSLMIATGGSTLANIQRGAGNSLEANRLYTLTMALLLGVGIFTLVTGLSALGVIPLLLGADAAIEALVSDYLRIILIFSPFFLIVFCQDLLDRKSTRLNSSHRPKSRMPSSA